MGIALSHRRAAACRAAGERPGRRAIGRRCGALLALALLALACLAANASADVGEKIIERCTHGQSISGFSQQDYRRALQELPTEVEEYSPCGNEIRQAQLAAARGGGGGNGGGNGAAPIAPKLSSSERKALRNVPRTGAEALHVGSGLVSPGVVRTNVASALSSLPAPLLAVLAFLLACALALGGRAIGRSVLARRSD